MSIREQKELGEKIRQARAIAKISQKDLAKIIGIGRVSLLKVEKGEREVNTSELKKIAEVIGKPVEFFLEEESEPYEAKTLDVTGIWTSPI